MNSTGQTATCAPSISRATYRLSKWPSQGPQGRPVSICAPLVLGRPGPRSLAAAATETCLTAGNTVGPQGWWGCFAGNGEDLGSSLFLQMCHIAVPSLTQIIKEKKRIRRVVIGGMATTYVLYAVLGLLTNLYFGSKVAVMITLNWEGMPCPRTALSFNECHRLPKLMVINKKENKLSVPMINGVEHLPHNSSG